MEQVWLTATALGIALHPINTLISMLARVERYHGVGLDRQEIQTVLELRQRFTRFFSVSLSDAEILLFRLSHAEPSPQTSLRRNITDVFSHG